MSKLIGVLLIVGGIAVGLYVGLWLMFIGGIIAIVNEVRAVEMSGLGVAVGVCRIVFAGFVGWIAAALLLIPGFAILQD